MSVSKQAVDHNELRDIRDVHIDTSLPKEARMRDFLRQIGNPYRYRHGKYVVTVRFVTAVRLSQISLKNTRPAVLRKASGAEAQNLICA